jgi:hypothetical protein
MVNQGEIPGAVIRDFQNFKNHAYALIFTLLVASFAINWSRIWTKLVLPASNADLLPYAIRMAALGVVILHILRWISNSTSELNLCIAHVNIGTPRPETFLAMFALAISLGIMPRAALMSFPMFAGYICLYSLIDLWVYSIFRRQYARCRRLTESETALHNEILQALDGFWLYRPHLRRIGVILVISTMAFFVSLGSSALQRPWSNLMDVLAAMLLLSTLLIADVVLSRWFAFQHDAIELASASAASETTTDVGR